MREGLGTRRWVLADGYIPTDSPGKPPKMLGHEAICILNTNADAAVVVQQTRLDSRQAENALFSAVAYPA